MSKRHSDLRIRELESLTEMKHAEVFQQLVWGDDDKPDNADLLLAVQHSGGLVAGAYHDKRMLGFLFGFPTSQAHRQHSQRLAVHPDSRGLSLGARLKWFQRDWCLKRGITEECWTYDPLLSTNAALNIERLGATVGIYHEDYYGKMEGINAGAPSDRLLAEWRLDSPRVARRADQARSEPVIVSGADLHVVIPADFTEMLSQDLASAVSERLRVRAELQGAFAEGYRIVGFNKQTCRYALSLLHE